MSNTARFLFSMIASLILLALFWLMMQAEVRSQGTCLNSITVGSTADSGPGTLRQALIDICDRGTIDFAAGLANQTIVLTSGELGITQTVTITNPNADGLGISGDNTHRVFDVQADGVVTISSLSVISGTATGGYPYDDRGGGVLVRPGATLTLMNGTIKGNSAYYGGGIYNYGQTFLADVILSGNNSALWGGGIYNREGVVILANSAVISNTASTAGGGGIYNRGTITLTNSLVSYNVASDEGGGIYNSGWAAGATLDNSVVSNNTADFRGGGISSDSGARTVLNYSSVDNNNASRGGGINSGYNTTTALNYSSVSGNNAAGGGGINSENATLTLSHSTVSRNIASMRGGGINGTHGSTALLHSVVDNNQTNGTGGGISIGGGLRLTNTMVISNVAGNSGGGVYSSAACGVVTVNESTVSYNVTNGTGVFEGGGGIYLSSKGVFQNSVVSNNTSGNVGGGIFTTFTGSSCEGTSILTNTTISDNTARSGGGLYYFSYTIGSLDSSTVANNTATGVGGGISSGSVVNLKNSIIAGNTAPSGPDCSSALNSEDYNLIQDVSNCSVGGITTHNITGRNPYLGSLQDNGGPTFTCALLHDSPAIDVGSCSGITTDQRGFPRPVDEPTVPNVDDGCDIGAYEFGSLMSIYLPIVLK